jgi:glycosidase
MMEILRDYCSSTRLPVQRNSGFFKLLTYCLVLILFLGFEANAQDPAQYGTPFSGVPNRMDANIYQMNLREYSSSRNIAGARQNLQRVKDLGINVIYLMPVFPLGVTNNPDGSPYSHRDLKNVASDLGTLSDLRGLVSDAHNLGMAVILDWVANQTAWDHPWITQHPDWYNTDGNGNIVPPCPNPSFCFNDVAWLDLNNSSAAAAMVDAMRYWVFAVNVDGFRFDWADKAPPAFWTNTVNNLRGISSHDLLLLAEGSNEGASTGCTPECGDNEPGYHYAQGFDYIFGTNFYWNVLKKVWNSGEPVTNLDGVTTGEYTGASSSQLVARYLSNHDDYNADGSPFSFLNGGRNAVMSAFVVASYHRGVPFIYNGIEVGNTNPLPYPWNSGNINWTQDLTVYTEMQKILNFRNSSVALRRGQPTSYIAPANTNPNVIAFTKTSGTEKVAVMVNVRNGNSTFTIPSGMAGSYINPYTNTNVTLTSGATQNLSAYQYIVLTNASVPVVAVTGVSVNPTSASVAAGLTTQLSASVAPSNATNQNVSWSSSNTAIATVTAAGLVTGVSQGTATITVTTQDGNKTANAAITVTPSSNFTVHFYRPAAWGTGINIYWWAAQPTGVLADGSWPGVSMTNEGGDWYSHTFTNVTSTNLIFNDGTNQSADLSRGTTGWYQNGIWYTSNPGACTPTSITPYTQVNGGSWNQVATATLDAGGSVALGPQPATGGSWSWSGPNSYTASVREITLTNVQVSQSGNYVATYTNTGGCTSNQTFSITVNSVGQTPFGGSAHAIPGTIEAEDFDNGGEATAYHDTDGSNNGGQYRGYEGVDIEVCSEGGYNIGWTNTDEWLEYSVNVSTAGSYDIALRVSSAGGGTVRVEFGGVDKTGNLTVPNTGGWQNWQTISATGVSLSAGSQIMRVYMNSGGYNLNNVTITTASGGGGGSAYRIKNRWQNTYLYDDGTQAKYGTPGAGSTTSHWTLEDVDGHKAIKNVGTGHYLNIENLQSYVECTSISTGAWSAQWILEDYDGHKRIRNRWQSGDYVHVENLLGYAQHGALEASWHSGQWTLETVSGSRLADETDQSAALIAASVEIYPNPFAAQVNVKATGWMENADCQLSVWDLSGKQVHQQIIRTDSNGLLNEWINTSSLKSGLYYFHIHSGGERMVFKMIKE